MNDVDRRGLLKTVGLGTGIALGVGTTAAKRDGHETAPSSEQTMPSSERATPSSGETFTADLDGRFTINEDDHDLDPEEKNQFSIVPEGESGTLEGTIYDDGTWESTDVDLPTVEDEEDGTDMTVDYYIEGTIEGEIDRESGWMTAEMPLRIYVEVDHTFGTNEGTVEIDTMDLTSGNSNAMLGSATDLDTTDGHVRLVDNEHTIPATGDEMVDHEDFFDLASNDPERNFLEFEMDMDLPEMPAPTGTVEGVVTADGDPVAREDVEFFDDGSTVDTALTQDDGSYEITLPVGTYTLEIAADGYDPYSTEVTVEENQTTERDITLGEDLGTVSGVVTDAHDTPLADVTVVFLDPMTGDIVLMTATDEQGEYDVELDGGEYTLTVDDERFDPFETSLSVADGSETVRDIDLDGPDPVVGDSRPRDLNGDGLYEDIDGDGESNVFDVQMLFDNMDDPAVTENAAYFNFSGQDDEAVGIFDVQALFGRL